MSAKQDRQGVRTAAQLEQKLNVSERFASIMGIATDARNAAEEAQRLIEQGMSQEEVFNILTNNGQSQGLYRGEDGELYINATYIKSGELIADLIKSGVLQSMDGKTKFNLGTGEITCTDELGQVVNVWNGCVTFQNAEGKKVLELYDLGFAGGITFRSGITGKLVGAFLGDEDGLRTSIKKATLFSGNVATGNTFTVKYTGDYDLFAVKLGTADSTENTVVLAYKNGNTINGVGGWAGTASLAKELFFLSATFSENTWTLVDARKQGIYNSASITTGTALNVKEVVGVI